MIAHNVNTVEAVAAELAALADAHRRFVVFSTGVVVGVLIVYWIARRERERADECYRLEQLAWREVADLEREVAELEGDEDVAAPAST